MSGNSEFCFRCSVHCITSNSIILNMKLLKYPVSLLLFLLPVLCLQAKPESPIGIQAEATGAEGDVSYRPELTEKFLEQFHADLGKYIISHSEGSHPPVPYHQGVDPVPLNLLGDYHGESIMVKFSVLANGHVGSVKAWNGVSPELAKYIESYVGTWLFFPRIKNGVATMIPRVSIPLKVKTAAPLLVVAPLLAQVDGNEDE